MLRVKNWRRFQVYKHRRPPWVRLYQELLDDPDWHGLDPAAAKVLVMLWLVAREDVNMAGTLPDIDKLAFRLRMSETELMACVKRLSHWLESDDATPIASCNHDDSAPLSTCLQDDTTETETDNTETEAECVAAQLDGEPNQNPRPAYSTDTKAMFMRLCGHEPVMAFIEWQEAGWDDATIRKALAAAEATGKKVKASYVNAILQRWATEGVPSNGRAANNGGNIKTSLDRMIAISEGKA